MSDETKHIEVDGVRLCGPNGAVPLEGLSDNDRAAIGDFAAFLKGGSHACPSCMMPIEECSLAEPCCPDCPQWHLAADKTIMRVT